MEDEEDGLLVLAALLLLHVVLMLLEQFGSKLDVSWLVHTMNVAESSSDGEVRADWAESLVDLVDVLGLGIEAVVVDALVVHAIFLTARDTDFHL